MTWKEMVGMTKKTSRRLFNTISPVYGLFYQAQKKRYGDIIQKFSHEIDLSSVSTVLDVGCGTGAFCSALHHFGLSVTGVDPAEKMLNIAIKQNTGQPIRFLQTNVLEGLPFQDNQFDIAIASYVAHGLERDERKRMYTEMSRVARLYVIIHDYNQKRSWLTSFVEWLEGGDYFHFIRHAETEMNDCVSEMKNCFSQVRVINVDIRANWYIGHVRDD